MYKQCSYLVAVTRDLEEVQKSPRNRTGLASESKMGFVPEQRNLPGFERLEQWIHRYGLVFVYERVPAIFLRVVGALHTHQTRHYPRLESI